MLLVRYVLIMKYMILRYFFQQCKMIGQFIQAMTDIGLACVQCDLTTVCRVELVQIAVFLHGKIFFFLLFISLELVLLDNLLAYFHK